MDKDVSAVACLGTNRSLTLDLQKRVAADGGGSKHAILARLSVESANHKLSLTAHGCTESLRDVEVSPLANESLNLCFCHREKLNLVVFQEEIQSVGSHIQTKLLERITTLQRLISEFRRQVNSLHDETTYSCIFLLYLPAVCFSATSPAVQRQRVAAGAECCGPGRVPTNRGTAATRERNLVGSVARRSPSTLCGRRPAALPQPPAARVPSGPAGVEE